MRAFPPLAPTLSLSRGSSSHHHIAPIKMSALAASSSFSSLAAMATTITSAASAAASSTAASAAATPISSTWLSTVANNKHWVGSAWIVTSAILTTYSTTKFLKYTDDEQMALPSTATGGSRAMLRRVSSVLNSTQKHDEQAMDTQQRRRSLGRPSMSRATLLTLYRFSGSLLLGLLIHSHFYDLSKLLPRFLQTLRSARTFLLPSMFLFVANYSNSIALDRIGISLTYTSKCGIPLITVLFTLMLDGISALPSNATLLSLVPIAVGIGAASWNSPTFELFGFLAAVLSTTSQAALNVASKRVMRRTGVRGPDAQRAMVLVALGIGLVMTGANSIAGSLRELRTYSANVRNLATEGDSTTESQVVLGPSHPPIWLTFLAVLAYHVEYVLSFSFVGLVEPITYGTCDALRRLLIIVAGRQLFGGDAFSKTNMGGIFMALLGALMYSITSAGGGPRGGLLKSG